MRQRRKHKRNLRRIQRKVVDARSAGHALRGHVRLNPHVVQVAALVRNREGPQGVEMQKIRTLQVPVPVTKSGSCDRPDIERPDCHREQQGLRAQAPRP